MASGAGGGVVPARPSNLRLRLGGYRLERAVYDHDLTRRLTSVRFPLSPPLLRDPRRVRKRQKKLQVSSTEDVFRPGSQWFALAVGCLIFVGACGRLDDSSQGAQTASPARSSAPASPVVSPSLTSFGPGDCTLSPPPGFSATRLHSNDDFSLFVPPGWTPNSEVGPTETVVARFTAPSTYLNAPTTVEVASLLGRYSSALEGAQQNFAPDPGVSNAAECQVAGDRAAFFQSTDHGQPVYRFFLVHHELLYMVTLKGSGGFDTGAIRDTKTVLGSWTWLS